MNRDRGRMLTYHLDAVGLPATASGATVTALEQALVAVS
jgi:hypothetical protein